MNVFDVLCRDHERMRQLANRLTGGKGDPPGSPREQHKLAERLVMEGSAHEAIEEQFFWPVVRDRLEGGDALASAGIQQEMGARNLLHELNRMKAGNQHFMTIVFSIASHLRSHATYEEVQIWPKLELALDRADLESIGNAMEAARKLAPTRPHPHTPPVAGLLRTVGPLVGAVDRAVDAMTLRGR